MKNSQNEKQKDNSALGYCPECKQPFKYLNIGSDQMAYCHQCQTKYKAGVNMFSTWLDEQEAKWRRNQKRLANYRTVKPLEEVQAEAETEDSPLFEHDVILGALTCYENYIEKEMLNTDEHTIIVEGEEYWHCILRKIKSIRSANKQAFADNN